MEYNAIFMQRWKQKNTLQVIFRSLHTRQSDIHPFSPETIRCRFDPIRRASRGHRGVREETSGQNIVDSETPRVDFVVDACPWHSIPHRIPPRSGKPLSTGSFPFQRAAPPFRPSWNRTFRTSQEERHVPDKHVGSRPNYRSGSVHAGAGSNGHNGCGRG